MMSELEVRHDGALFGYLVEGPPSVWSFVYTDEWLHRGSAQRHKLLALGWPPRKDAYHGDDLRVWFENLLPEGDVRRQLARRLGISAANDFALLAATGGDCQGAVTLNRPGDAMVAERQTRALTDQEFRNVVAALPLRPLLAEVEGARLALPGEHHKIPLTVVDDQLALVLGSAPSSHIAKPSKPGLRESVFNEAFCMELGRALALPVAGSEIRHGPATVLLIERIDRRLSGGAIERLHMEDFCQILRVSPQQKYEREGGTSLAECAAAVRRFSTAPALDLRALVGWVVFNFLIGNGGAHGKQLALLHEETGPRLGAFFGLSSTHVYPELSHRLAMSVGGEDRPDWLIAARWREAATQMAIKPAYVIEALQTMARRIPRVAATVAEGFQRRNGFAAVVRDIRRLIEQRSRQVLVSLQAEAV